MNLQTLTRLKDAVYGNDETKHSPAFGASCPCRRCRNTTGVLTLSEEKFLVDNLCSNVATVRLLKAEIQDAVDRMRSL